MTTILENASGVRITEEDKRHGHHLAVGALCHCGEYLIVAPTIYQADHRKGDPVMVCGDHGVHAFRFLDPVKGLQPEAKPRPTTLTNYAATPARSPIQPEMCPP